MGVTHIGGFPPENWQAFLVPGWMRICPPWFPCSALTEIGQWVYNERIFLIFVVTTAHMLFTYVYVSTRNLSVEFLKEKKQEIYRSDPNIQPDIQQEEPSIPAIAFGTTKQIKKFVMKTGGVIVNLRIQKNQKIMCSTFSICKWFREEVQREACRNFLCLRPWLVLELKTRNVTLKLVEAILVFQTTKIFLISLIRRVITSTFPKFEKENLFNTKEKVNKQVLSKSRNYFCIETLLVYFISE